MIKLIVVLLLAAIIMVLYRKWHIVLYERMAIVLLTFNVDVDNPQTDKVVKNILRILFIITILSTGFLFTLSPLVFVIGVFIGMIPRVRPRIPPDTL